ncbi:MAG: LysR family transcriptional regulator [Clostridia bacterium]|nr:LysR family transcriptional regulator [Clostridia bacterium]
MEIRVLQYFLAVAREQSISAAANSLHLSQPTLSRQLRDMEDELGKQLFIRGNKKIELTSEGMILRQRAQEIVDLVRKTENEITASDDHISGDIYIGAGETVAVRFLTQAANTIRRTYPDIHFHIISGDDTDVKEQLDDGLIDFGLVFGNIDDTKYEAIKIPMEDTWGILMRKDSPLANQAEIHAKDLYGEPLIVSRHSLKSGIIKKILGRDTDMLNITATYTLLFNGSLMVQDGIGYALALDNIINTSGNSELVFIPLAGEHKETVHIIWKKNHIFSDVSEIFLNQLNNKN